MSMKSTQKRPPSVASDETEYDLERFVQVTLDSNGAGNVTNVGPTQHGERWEINGFSATGTMNSRLQVMRGNSFTAARQLDLTDRAIGDSSDTDLKLMAGESISFWWTNGVAGSVMTCTIRGSRFVKGRRAY